MTNFCTKFEIREQLISLTTTQILVPKSQPTTSVRIVRRKIFQFKDTKALHGLATKKQSLYHIR